MAIRALPSDTRRLLGSACLIPTSASLVKELLDNAIDAGATSIEVLLSPNTVDKVEVRDNGQGILAADFDALGRRGHTSKFCHSGDLRATGGASLGFRGEGLASANALGFVTITTRTASDAVASTFRLVPGLGGVSSVSQKPVSAPVGTTVSVACLFFALPVRRRVAVQDAAKTVAAIKNTLRGYALARPNLRLACKTLQNAGSAWYYRPMANPAIVSSGTGALKQAVLMLFGSEVARQCQEVVRSSGELLDGQATLSQALSACGASRSQEFVFEASLPRPGADLSILTMGGFLSVDGRPLSSQNSGIAVKLLTVFRTHLGRSAMHHGSQKHQPRVHDAFLRLDIKCPPGSYDPDVDPSKADVLFADEGFLCDAFEKLCSDIYGDGGARRLSQAGDIPPRTPLHNRMCVQFPGTPPGSQIQTRRQALVSPGSPSMLLSRPSELGFRLTPLQGRAARDADDSPIHIPVSTLVRRRRQHAAPARGLQTPPPSRPAEGRHREVRDGLRQTTIAFGARPNATHRLPELGGKPGAQAARPVLDASRSCFASGSSLRRPEQRSTTGQPLPLEQDTDGPTVAPPEEARVRAGSQSLQQSEAAGENEASGDLRKPASRTWAPRRAAHTVEVDMWQLRKGAVRLIRNAKTWEAISEPLLPDTPDFPQIESRLKAAITSWLGRTRAEREGAGGGPVQVEFYLKKSLKKKAIGGLEV